MWWQEIDGLAVSGAALMSLLLLWIICGRRGRAGQRSQAKDGLDQPIYWFDALNCLTRRDLVRSIAALGGTGSGKTSGVLYQIMKCILRDRHIGGCILTSKFGEEREFWLKVFRETGRLHDLHIVAPDKPLPFNWLGWELEQGADSRDLANLIMTAGETRDRGSGGGGNENAEFFRAAGERMLQMGIEAQRLASGRLEPWELQRFLNGAAQNRAELTSDAFKAGFHWQTMKAAHYAQKDALAKADYEQCVEYFFQQLPSLNDRTRSSIEIQVNQVLYSLTSGIVRQMLGGVTEITPAVVDGGGWILIDMPGTRYGTSGQFLNAAWKLAVQRHVLRRHAKSGDAITLLVIDEFQNHGNSFDAKYLSECRSRKGGMFILSQSVHALVNAMGGDMRGETQTQALLANFGHKIIATLSDDKSGAFASALCGRERQLLLSGSQQPNTDIYDELFGAHRGYSSSFSEHYEQVVQNQEFMHGLRCGGPPDFMVDAWVLKAGLPFKNGKNHLLCEFSQR